MHSSNNNGIDVRHRDQELRFTVHDSPDYYQLKISVFSEDKRTDLIGEAWVGLNDVVVPGGGKADLWQGLNCKGKYAGDLRIELTYYDTRAKPEKAEEILSVAEELRQQYGSLQPKVKRRPLPTNPNAPSMTPVVIPDRAPPGRARHGPRDLQMPHRAGSTPAETLSYPHSAATLVGQTPVHPTAITPGPPAGLELASSPTQYYGEYDQNPDPEVYDPHSTGMPQQPDFLPQLPPSSRQRGAQPRFAQRASQPQLYQNQHSHPPQPRPLSHIGLPHSHSAPAVPAAHEDDYLYENDYPETYPNAEYHHSHQRQRRNDVPPGWEQEFPTHQPYVEDEMDGPPPPPVHSNSSPAVPHYGSAHGRAYPPVAARLGTTPPTARHAYMPNSSPIQSIEQGYSPAQPSYGYRNPTRGASFDEYGSSPYQHSYESTPNLTSAHQSPSPLGRTPPYRQMPGRHSFAEPNTTPSRPHPLSQQVPRARSPNPNPYPRREVPEAAQEGAQYADYRERGRAQSANSRAASPQPPLQQPQSAGRPAKNTYSIQFPVRAFESSDASPLSTSQPSSASRPLPSRASAPPMRKSVSPRPSMSEGSSAVPFSPDSFDVHNPQPSNGEGSGVRDARSGPIVGWHGQEIDPSDHLPVDSWAPEPTKKTPTKTYGLGRDRDFGPRTVQGGSAGRTPRDTVINVRLKAQSQEPEPTRNRVRKSPIPGRSPSMEPPMREHENFNPVPNPYEQPNPPFSREFRDGSRSPGGYGGGSPGGYGSAPPSIPPKVPLNYDGDALSREISSIDIGTRQRAPTSFVPVRSHRDRHNYY